MPALVTFFCKVVQYPGFSYGSSNANKSHFIIRDKRASVFKKRDSLKERPDVGVYVKDLSSVTVSSADHMARIMQFGSNNR